MTKPTEAEVREAVKTLILWTGDNPDREGLIETPKRVAKAYKEFFSGYNINPKEVLGKTFKEVAGYDDIVLLKDMRLESHCEHHMVPFIGKAHIAYIPNKKIVGISKNQFGLTVRFLDNNFVTQFQRNFFTTISS